MKKKFVIVLLFGLIVGFAGVATNLLLNGTLNLASDIDGFDADVVFTRATTDEEGSAIISEDGKTITFSSKELSILNEIARLDFDITNKNRNYDAVATIQCNNKPSEYADYVSVLPNQTTYEINASETINDFLIAKLVRVFAGSTSVTTEFTCEIVATPKERDELAPKYSIVKKISGDGTNLGDELAIGDEHFYVLSNDGINVRMLAKYNLYVGGEFYVSTTGHSSYTAYDEGKITGMQDSEMRGYYGYEPPMQMLGVTAYSEVSADYSGSLAEKYINGYVDKLKSKYNVEVSGSLITKQEVDSLAQETLNSRDDLSNYDNIPKWLYSTSYWTYLDSASAWTIDCTGILYDRYAEGEYWTYNEMYGIRPVITISSDLL